MHLCNIILLAKQCLPVKFARENIPEQENKLRLCVKSEGTWSMKCSLSPGKANMTGGWRNFVKDNGLRVGDVCVFEVNGCENLLWNVTIFREYESGTEPVIMKDVSTSLKGRRKGNHGKGNRKLKTQFVCGLTFQNDNQYQFVILQYFSEERLKMRRSMNKKTCRTYKMAKAHAFDNPVYITVMQPSYVTPPFSLVS